MNHNKNCGNPSQAISLQVFTTRLPPVVTLSVMNSTAAR